MQSNLQRSVALYARPLWILLAVSAPTEAATVFLWSGAVTDSSLRVTAKTDDPSSVVRLALAPDSTFTSPAFTEPDAMTPVSGGMIYSFSLSNLAPDQGFVYALEEDGSIDLSTIGSCRTFPAGQVSFTFAFASCSWTGSNHPVFSEIAKRRPLFFLHLGDMHYENIGVNDPNRFRTALERALLSPSQSELHRGLPLDYVWDDHDYGPNNSDSTAPGRVAARSVYREYFPHYPLVEGDDTAAAIYHTFDVGRVRFIVCDSRSARSPASAQDVPGKTMLGATQKAWFKQQLLAARDAGKLIVWVNTLPWIGETGDDGWHLYTHERRELANFIADNRITNLCMISGDAHMLAIDNGANSDYSDNGGAGFPVMHSAPLDRLPSAKGGPYSEGVVLASAGQFGTMTVTDLGDSLRVLWQGWRMGEEFMRFQFAFAMRSCPAEYLC
ncbi:MAG TPA: alkaline phosphatase D family protein, partial [candidate division Zixibacteria bacterium]|nr:alkaline phosphatase D family protein [candidate division Zixibacteria bacterium]